MTLAKNVQPGQLCAPPATFVDVKSIDRDLRVEWHKSASDIPSEAWATCFPEPLEGLWLYSTLDKSGLEDQFDFAYAVVMRGPMILAIAPVFMTLLPISIIAPRIVDRALSLGGSFLRHLRFQRTLFVGSPCADEGVVGTAPGVELADVACVLQAALWKRAATSDCFMVAWKDVPERSWQALRALAREAGLSETQSYPGALVRDIGGSFDDYLNRLTVKQRHNLRRKLRLSRENIDLVTQIVSAPDKSTIDDIWRLFQNTYAKASTKFERLTRRFWEIVSHQESSRLIVLRERNSGTAVAFMLAIMQRGRAINKFIGLDYTVGDKSFLYFRLWEEFLRLAVANGASEVQSGQTSYRAKLDLGHELVALHNFFRYRNRAVHAIASAVARRISWSTLDENLRQHLASSPRRESAPSTRIARRQAAKRQASGQQ